ncbi:MAG: YebC/PmpR family DNA-binding transcriptional regulator [Actinomycetota bacterium]|nr:YebC/PmpR family DNA-binding transcriptional regulator [Actinomycetota bacterium]
MSGHSKWATIKHKKAAIDKVRGKTFAKLSRLLEVAAREGGGDVSINAALRTVVSKAKAAQMTNEAIDRAIKRGMGETDGKVYESVTYEAYAPGGVAMLIDILTDNRNRTAADVRIIFSKQGGSMAAPGSVGWQFSRKGVILVAKSASEEELMTIGLDHGLEDITADEEMWHITSEPSQVYELKAAYEASKISVSSATTTMLSSNTVAVTDPADAKAILKIMHELDDNDDVQDVYANFDISETLMQEVG